MPQNVLVVDDQPEIRNLMVEILKKRGYQVSTASDGHDALTQFALARPDLVITDLTMLGLNGYQLCRLIRGISSVPVLVMSAQMGAEDMAYRMGADAFIPKPFDLEDLWAEIEELLLETCSPIMA
ncbi:MAG: response regulator [Chloroflexota bacterium]|nr:response regulator [Chloroflexota bacterium]